MCHSSVRLQTPHLSHSAFENKRCASSGAWDFAVPLPLGIRLARPAETSSSIRRQAHAARTKVRNAACAHHDDQAAAEGLPAVYVCDHPGHLHARVMKGPRIQHTS